MARHDKPFDQDLWWFTPLIYAGLCIAFGLANLFGAL
jgi:hypothetical protein